MSQLTTYCHWRPPDAMPLLILNVFFGLRDTSDLISIIAFTSTMQRHRIRLVSAPSISFRLANFRWAPFADLRVRRLATMQNAQLTEGMRKCRSYYKPSVDHSLWNFGTILEPTFERLCPIVYIMFRLEDIRH